VINGATNIAEPSASTLPQVSGVDTGIGISKEPRAPSTCRRGLNRVGASGRLKRMEGPVSTGRSNKASFTQAGVAQLVRAAVS
jgi:hypothetical protein